MAQGSAVLFAAQVIGNAGFFAAVLILARGLGPAGRGAVAFFIVTTMVTARAAGIGVREATTVFAARDPLKRPVLLSNLALASVASGALGGVLVSGALALLAGVRPAGSGHGDQVRVATPAEAITAGASYIVVGRPITEAADPVAEARAILEQMGL